MKELKNEELPDWVKARGHPLPFHRYYLRDDGAIMVVCPNEPNDLNLWAWDCQCQSATKHVKK